MKPNYQKFSRIPKKIYKSIFPKGTSFTILNVLTKKIYDLAKIGEL